ncbi:response regulator [Bosea lathyri]|uniref:Response regulator receiver domain-containing protein n=1 Tax=Bosea lathyri TaxID=1036778 RepID=A0A1H5XNR1_9HYPH|nr:response regulator [Bosea lathyri]SEG13419.1 Response regulator receiver domain-containing protein [Bosea lathyri]
MPSQIAKPVVLIVDDEPILRMHAAMIADDAGLSAVEAETADEAISILETRSDIRLVFTDIEMPGSMNGLKLADFVRDSWPDISLIVASGRVRVAEDSLPTGARFFSKPYPERELVQTMQRMAA